MALLPTTLSGLTFVQSSPLFTYHCEAFMLIDTMPLHVRRCCNVVQDQAPSSPLLRRLLSSSEVSRRIYVLVLVT